MSITSLACGAGVAAGADALTALAVAQPCSGTLHRLVRRIDSVRLVGPRRAKWTLSCGVSVAINSLYPHGLCRGNLRSEQSGDSDHQPSKHEHVLPLPQNPCPLHELGQIATAVSTISNPSNVCLIFIISWKLLNLQPTDPHSTRPRL